MNIRNLYFAVFLLVGIALVGMVGNQYFRRPEPVLEVPAEVEQNPIGTDSSNSPDQAVGALKDKAVEALKDKDLIEASNLRYEFEDGGSEVVAIFHRNGSFTHELIQGDDVCMSAYESESNVMLGYCTGPEGVDAFRWSNVPSSGYDSKKYFQAMSFASVPPYLGASTLDPSNNSRGLVAGSVIAKAREGSDVSFSAVADGASGLLVDSGTPELVVSNLLTAPGDLGHQTFMSRVQRIVGSAPTLTEEDWGFQQVASIAEANDLSSYSVPSYDLPPGYTLRDVFYASEARLPGADGNPPSVDVVIQVYSQGVRELVVTTRARNPRAAFGQDDSRVSLSDEGVAWLNDPIDFAGEGYPLEDDGWSNLIQTPHLPTHFWGVDGDAVVVVEGYLIAAAELDQIRQTIG